MNEEMNGQIIQKLAIKIAQLEVDKSVLEVQLAQLEQEIFELKNTDSVETAE